MNTLVKRKSLVDAVASRQKKYAERGSLARMNSRRMKDASRWAYSLGETGAVGHDDPGSTVLSINEDELWCDFLLTKVRRDLHGDVVVPRGCEEFLPDYAANAQVFFAHKQDGLPIAKATDKNNKLFLKISDDDIISRAFFHDVTQESVDVFKLLALGFLKGASISFVPVTGELIPPAEQDSSSDDIVFDFGGIIFKTWKLLEFSVVPIPANPGALRGYLASEKSMSAGVRRTLEPLAASKKIATVVSPGFYVDKREIAKMPMEDLIPAVAPSHDTKPEKPPEEKPEEKDDGDACQALLFSVEKFADEEAVKSWMQAHAEEYGEGESFHPGEPDAEDDDTKAHCVILFASELCEADTAHRDVVEEGVTGVYCAKQEQGEDDASESQSSEGDNKSLKTASEKNMPTAKVKSAFDEEDNKDEKPLEQDSATEDKPEVEEEDDTPHGCKVLCEIHDLHTKACQHCEVSQKKLEHEGVKKFLAKSMEKIQKLADETDEFAAKTYPDHYKSKKKSDGKKKSPAKEDDAEEDKSDDEDKPEDKKKSLIAGTRTKIAKKDLSTISESAEFMDELATEDNLKKSQKAACRAYSTSLKGLTEKLGAGESPEGETRSLSKQAVEAEETPAILALLKQIEETDRKMKEQLYALTGAEI